MKITTLTLAVGLLSLAACNQAAEENVDANADANLTMPADNFDTMDANAAVDANLGNDATMANDTANADANTATENSGY